MEVELNDEALVEKYRQSQDMNAFKSLVGRYQNRVFNSAYRMLGNREEAEEVVQDTFVKIHQGIDRFRNESSTFGAWIFRISHNLCVDILRARKRKKGLQFIPFISRSTVEDPDGEYFELGVQQIADSSLDPGYKLDMKEEGEIIEASLANLPANQRAVLILHDIEGFSYQEIADIIGTSIGTIRSRLHYGRIKLRDLLDVYYSTNQPITPR